MDDRTAAFIIGCKTPEPVTATGRFVSQYHVIRTMTIWIELPATCDRVVSWAILQSPIDACYRPTRWSLITNPRTSTAIVSQWKMLLKWQVTIRKIQNTRSENFVTNSGSHNFPWWSIKKPVQRCSWPDDSMQIRYSVVFIIKVF